MADPRAAKLQALKAIISEMVDDIASEGAPPVEEVAPEVEAAPEEEDVSLDPAQSEEMKRRMAELMAE